MNRRNLLAGGLALAGGRAAAARRLEPAIATITCDGFGDEDFRHAFETIPRLGLRNVEFNCWYARNLTPAGIESIRQRCRRKGLTPVSIQGNGFVGGDGHDLAREAHRVLWLMEVR